MQDNRALVRSNKGVASLALAAGLVCWCLAVMVIPAHSGGPLPTSFGQTLYVPAFSQIALDQGRFQPLASNLIVHNVDPERSITVTGVAYYDSAGALVRRFLDEPVTLTSFASYEALVPLREQEGGSGANFIVTWEAEEAALPPHVEAVMIGGTGTLGISFSSRARVIGEAEPR